MLSYRHGFHAGNFADVHKHAVLSLLLQYLLLKERGFFYLDTHAGAGLYDLGSEFARKNAEHEQGIARLWQRADAPDALRPYLEAVRGLNPATDGAARLRRYPGSPYLARRFLRPQDRMLLTELHGSELPALRALFAGDRQVAIHGQDAYQGLKAFLPPPERRGLVLIDPAYERRDEFARVVAGLQTGWRRWPTGVYAIWYPIVTRAHVDRFHRQVVASGVHKVLLSELLLTPDPGTSRMHGSGMLVINPPWRLQEQLSTLGPWLLEALGGSGEVRLDWLVPEGSGEPRG